VHINAIRRVSQPALDVFCRFVLNVSLNGMLTTCSIVPLCDLCDGARFCACAGPPLHHVATASSGRIQMEVDVSAMAPGHYDVRCSMQNEKGPLAAYVPSRRMRVYRKRGQLVRAPVGDTDSLRAHQDMHSSTLSHFWRRPSSATNLSGPAWHSNKSQLADLHSAKSASDESVGRRREIRVRAAHRLLD
jgi:hypothetical protein